MHGINWLLAISVTRKLCCCVELMSSVCIGSRNHYLHNHVGKGLFVDWSVNDFNLSRFFLNLKQQFGYTMVVGRIPHTDGETRWTRQHPAQTCHAEYLLLICSQSRKWSNCWRFWRTSVLRTLWRRRRWEIPKKIHSKLTGKLNGSKNIKPMCNFWRAAEFLRTDQATAVADFANDLMNTSKVLKKLVDEPVLNMKEDDQYKHLCKRWSLNWRYRPHKV